MESWWPEKLRQRKSKLLAFILDFCQESLPKSENSIDIYKKLLEAINIPTIPVGIYFESHVGLLPEEKKKREQLLKDMPEPQLILPFEPSKVVLFQDPPKKDSKVVMQMFFSNEEDFLKFISQLLEKYREKLYPIVKICYQIALLIEKKEKAELEACIGPLSYCLHAIAIKNSPNLYSPFLAKFPKKEQKIEIKNLKNDDKISFEIPSQSLPFVKHFFDFLLEGLNPLRFRLCKVCSKVFYAVNPRGVYCSNACRQRAYRKRKKGSEEEA